MRTDEMLKVEDHSEALRTRLDALCALLRQYPCNVDTAMSVGRCVDSDLCGCSAGLLLQEPRA